MLHEEAFRPAGSAGDSPSDGGRAQHPRPLAGAVDLVRSPAHLLENSLNPVAARRDAVSLWLSNGPITRPDEAALSARIQSLVAAGFRSFDAFHLASAEISESAVFVTVDLRLLKLAGRLSGSLATRVTDPVCLVEEIVQWSH